MVKHRHWFRPVPSIGPSTNSTHVQAFRSIGVMTKVIFSFVVSVSVLCGSPSKGEEPRTRAFDFEGHLEGTVPDGFEVGMTGSWKATEWSVRKVSGNQVLAHVGFWDEDPEGVFPVCWVRNAEARDLTLTVRLFPVQPPAAYPNAEHDGAGIVLRFKDPDNYYLLRAVPLEKRVRFYKVEQGKRSTLAGLNLEVEVDRWHTLALKAQGDVFTAYFDGRELFSHQDQTFRHAGAFGLWSKPNNVTYFDDLKAEISN